MKTTPRIQSNLLVQSEPMTGALAPAPRRANPEKEHRPTAMKPQAASARASGKLPELTTFRALSRQVFGAEAAREYIAEAIVFASMMLVAAWPLSVALNQLGTMMISPPHTLW